jgi:CNT family concentrative nucleoside transporter
MIVGQMLGEKTILNEFVAYASLMEYTNINSPVYGMLSERSILLCTYALLGFANFASIGIQIGGIGAIAPGQRKTLTMLGVRALIGGTIASLLTASVVCIIL